MPSITIKPACLLVDDTPQITVTGLRPYQKVTLASHLPNGALSYLAYAHYVTTEAGGLTNTHSKSLSGTFTGRTLVFLSIYLNVWRCPRYLLSTIWIQG